jgi:predicted nucleotide-binding protein
MPSNFSGDFETLKDQLLVAGIDGEWIERANQVWTLKCADGSGVNWSATKGTLWCDGNPALKSALEQKVADAIGAPFARSAAPIRKTAAPASRKVFVVYGHSDKARTELEAMLRRWDLEPLILDQLTSGGQTIIEKLESVRREAVFAVVLATPDDEGHRREHPEEKAYRARQNVVLELGMMLAVLGRSKVAIVLKTDVQMERPSDIQGLIYVSFRDDVREAALTLAKEINGQGIPIDLSKV